MTRYWLLLLLCTVGCGGQPAARLAGPPPTVPPVVTQPTPPPTVTPPDNSSVPTDWTVTDLVPLPGHTGAQANAVNKSGMAVGYSINPDGVPHAVYWADGQVIELGIGVATAINDSGVVVGYFSDGGGNLHALWWSNGETRDMGDWLPTGINNHGFIVGVSNDLRSMSSNGEIPGCMAALGVNDSGQVAGISSVTDRTATICGQTDYGVVGAATAINGKGMAVGFREVDPETGDDDAMVWPGTDIEQHALATGVNDYGWVIGDQITEQSPPSLRDRLFKPRLAGTSHPFIWSKETGVTFLPGELVTANGISGQFVVGAGLVGDEIHGMLLTGN